VMVARGPASLLNRYRRFQEADLAKPDTGPVARPKRRVRRIETAAKSQ
jgi:hypothetical protein